MKVRLNDNYTIGFPPLVCSPLNADFDGDSVSIQLVPEDVAEDTYEKMSPRYSNVYKKTKTPIFVFSHEALNGAAVATEYKPEDLSDLEDPKYFYTDYTQLLKDVEIEKKIGIGTPISFTGKIGSVDYQSKTTTYGRLRVSKIIDADIDKIGIFKEQYDRINSGAAAKLSLYLLQFPDGIEKLKLLQDFFYKVVTKSGVVTFDYKTLYVDYDNEKYKEMCNIADSKELTDKQKLLLLTEKYKEYEQSVADMYSKDLKKDIKMAERVKLESITSMTSPMLILSSVDEIPMVTRGTLLTGLNEKDYQIHAIENRSLQSIKQSGVTKLPELLRSFTIKIQRIAGNDVVS